MTQTAVFFVALFASTWTWQLLIAPSVITSEGGPSQLLRTLPVAWAPTIIALAMTAFAAGGDGVRKEIEARLAYTSGSARWLIVALIVPVVATTVAVLGARMAGEGAPFISANALPMVIGLQVITGASGEELGWRGYLLPRLRPLIGEVRAGLVMGLFWGLWHLPAFFTPGTPHQMIPMLSFLLLAVLLGVFLASLFFRTGESVLVTMLAHFALNTTLSVGGAQLSSTVFWQTLPAVYGLIVLVVIAMPSQQRQRSSSSSQVVSGAP